MSIPNPRVCYRYPIPELSDQEYAELEEAIEEADRLEALDRMKPYLCRAFVPDSGGFLRQHLIDQMNRDLQGTGYEVDPDCRPMIDGTIHLIKIDPANPPRYKIGRVEPTNRFFYKELPIEYWRSYGILHQVYSACQQFQDITQTYIFRIK